MINSKRKPNVEESDSGGEFNNNIFQEVSNKNEIKIFSRNTSVGAVFAEHFNRTISDLLKRAVFEKGDGNWIDVLPTITKQYNNKIHTSTKPSPKEASLRKNDGCVYKNLLDKPKKMKPKYEIGDLVRTTNLKKTFSKRDTTNWS